MGLTIGLGVPLGQALTALVPVVDTFIPAVSVPSRSDVVVTSPEVIGPGDITTMLNGSGITCEIVSLADFSTVVSGGVTAMQDFSGLAQHWAQGGAAGTRPAFTAVDATLGNRSSFLTDGVASWLPNAWNQGAPSLATPIFARVFAKHIARAGTNASLLETSSTGRGIIDSAASPNIKAGWGTANTADISMTLGQWFAIDLYLAADTTDYLWCGSTKSTGVNLGNFNGSGWGLGATFAGAAFGNYAFGGAILLQGGDVTGTKRTNLDTFCAKWFKGALTLPT